MNYYKLPIQADKITNCNKSSTVNLEQSIHQMISLICTTAYKEYEYDARFGSVIWEMDFDNMFNVHLVKNELKIALQEAVELYEKRVILESLRINIEQLDFVYKGLKTKMKLTVIFKMKIKTTDIILKHIEEFFIGPLSYIWKK